MNTPDTSRNALDHAEELLRQVLVLKTDEHYWALTLWIAFCYSIPEFKFAPRLCFWSPQKRCGKTLALEIVSHLLPNALLTSSMSSASLFRILDTDPTRVILIDESDTVFGRNGDKEKAETLRGLLNASFKRGQSVFRCEGPKNEVREYKIFAPIALAGIGTSAIPETVADRALMIEMRRMLPNEQILEFESDEEDSLFAPVRDELETFARKYESRYKHILPDLPREKLNARARDIWKPLCKIAECGGQEWIEKALKASLALSSGEAEPEEASLSILLLDDIREVFYPAEEKLSTKDLMSRLTELEESPWPSRERFTAHTIARMLKDYGIRPTAFGGGKVRGYYRKSFEDSWSRYLEPLESVTSVTSVTVEDKSESLW